ncbi:MAG: prepilin signal peptidase PulO-like peptidase [Acidimicrobiia bacterium]|nr:prepilin signal peptidase PulO-like peptidase [Acidimicrobiia bacterium]
MVIVACVLLALLSGSLLVRLIERVPERDPARRVPVLAPLRCEGCAQELGAPGHVLLLTTQCPGCGSGRGLRPRAVQATLALVFGLTGAHFGSDWALLPYLFLGAVLVAVAFVDLDTLRIPDRLLFPALGVAVPLLVGVSFIDGKAGRIGSAALGAAVFFGILLLFNLVYPAGMGFGDVKLALLLGWYIGWINSWLVMYALIIAAMLGSVVGIALLVITRDRKRAFPFGPFLCVGTLAVVLYGSHLLPR